MSTVTLLLASPAWNFAEESAASAANRYIVLERLDGADLKLAFNRRCNFDFAQPISDQLRGNSKRFQPSISPTPYHLINGLFVAYVSPGSFLSGSSRFEQKVWEVRGPQTSSVEDFHPWLDKQFARQITLDIADWNTMVHHKLRAIVACCLAGFAITLSLAHYISRYNPSFYNGSAAKCCFRASLVFAALAGLAFIRLQQFYSLARRNITIEHVGQWVVNLWNAVQFDPTLLKKYPAVEEIFYPIPSRPEVSSAEKRELFLGAISKRSK